MSQPMPGQPMNDGTPTGYGSRYPSASKDERRKAFIDEWKKKKAEEREGHNLDEKIVLRDPKAKLITFEI